MEVKPGRTIYGIMISNWRERFKGNLPQHFATPLAAHPGRPDTPRQTARNPRRPREDDMAEDAIPRRGFLKGAGAAGAAAATVLTGRPKPAQAQTPAPSAAAEPAASEVYLTLTAT